MLHYSVLKNEIIDAINVKSDGIYVDATLGYAGMSKEILKKLDKGMLYGIDQDKEARIYADEELKKIGTNYQIIAANFANMKSELEKRGVTEVDGIIFDLGFSSPQIDDAERGFSFMHDGLLDMRMNQDSEIDAKKIVNEYKEDELSNIFFKYGEEKLSKVIAKGIVKARCVKQITRTLELVEIIKNSVGANYFFKQHPERKIFQALRIEVNQELCVLEQVLPDAIDLLKKSGRLGVITFHSLEDKIVKDTFKKYSEVDELVKGIPNIPDEYKPKLKIVNKKPITASAKELVENSRSHSAKLRVVERI